MHDILERLFRAADNHAEDTGEDHTVGDLQGLMSLAWGLMTANQRTQFLESDEVQSLTELGARDEFNVQDLMTSLTASLADMESAITAAGYSVETADAIPTHKSRFSWTRGREFEEDFQTRKDAIMDAYHHLSASKTQN